MSYNDKFAFWKANVYDEEIRNELNKLEGDEVAKENCFFKDLSFGTAGIRGKLGARQLRQHLHGCPRRQSICGFSQQEKSAVGCH